MRERENGGSGWGKCRIISRLLFLYPLPKVFERGLAYHKRAAQEWPVSMAWHEQKYSFLALEGRENSPLFFWAFEKGT